MKNKIVIITLSIVSLIAVAVATAQVMEWKAAAEKANGYNRLAKRLQYYQEAERINEYYSSRNIMTRVSVIRETLEQIDHFVPIYFPEGPYSRNDLIAMAMVESEFDQYLVGTHKEFGIFQIMPEACKDAGIKRNQFEISVNTELALIVLSQKYSVHPDYRIAVIAYNGLVKKDGKLSQTYWKRFIKARKLVDDIFSNSSTPSK